jgi:hypothetical protein
MGTSTPYNLMGLQTSYKEGSNYFYLYLYYSSQNKLLSDVATLIIMSCGYSTYQ